MPTAVKSFPAESLERKAYDAVAGIPALEPNDTSRLGYHVFLFLKEELSSIQEAIHVAQARLLVSDKEAEQTIQNRLEEYGIELTR